eukprot:gene736-1414_t
MSTNTNVYPRFPHATFGNIKSKSLIILVSGFPDSEISGWGQVLENLETDNRVIALCLPGLSSRQDKNPNKSWGYSISELVEGLHLTIHQLLMEEETKYSKFVLIGHDWGSYLAQLYQNRYSDDVSKIICLDVGQIPFKNATLFQMIVIIFYQGWFAISYLISQIFGSFLGNTSLYLSLPLMTLFGPCPYEKKLTIPFSQFHVGLCYIYLRFGMAYVTGNLPRSHFPSCPLLYIYGTMKRIMFHDSAFIQNIRTLSPSGSRYVAVDTGHWMMLDAPDICLAEIRSFLSQ